MDSLIVISLKGFRLQAVNKEEEGVPFTVMGCPLLMLKTFFQLELFQSGVGYKNDRNDDMSMGPYDLNGALEIGKSENMGIDEIYFLFTRLYGLYQLRNLMLAPT